MKNFVRLLTAAAILFLSTAVATSADNFVGVRNLVSRRIPSLVGRVEFSERQPPVMLILMSFTSRTES